MSNQLNTTCTKLHFCIFSTNLGLPTISVSVQTEPAMLSASGLLANGNAATILANGNAYALPAPKVIQFKVSYYHIHDEKWWDIKKISAYLDNGVSTGESQSGMLNNSDLECSVHKLNIFSSVAPSATRKCQSRSA